MCDVLRATCKNISLCTQHVERSTLNTNEVTNVR